MGELMREPVSEIIRAATRPILTILGLISWTTLILADIEYPEAYQYAVIGMICWWFGERFIKKIRVK